MSPPGRKLTFKRIHTMSDQDPTADIGAAAQLSELREVVSEARQEAYGANFPRLMTLLSDVLTEPLDFVAEFLTVLPSSPPARGTNSFQWTSSATPRAVL
jgi:hypothetical protein